MEINGLMISVMEINDLKILEMEGKKGRVAKLL